MTQTILLVDDNKEIVEAVRTALLAEGYDVIAAHDGTEGLKRAERDAPDLIILDLVMPQRSGFGMLEHLHPERPESPPVIMLTANDEDRFRQTAMKKGATCFMAKPFRLDELIDTVKEVLSRKRSEQANTPQ